MTMTNGQPYDRFTVIATIVAIAALYTSLWDPWKDFFTSIKVDVTVYVILFLIPLIIILYLLRDWIRTH